MRTVQPGDLVLDQFPALESDGYTKRSGLTGADFTVSTFHNSDPVALPVTITEIGTLGEYRVSYTPTAVGVWLVEVLINFNKDIWKSEVSAETATTSEDMKRILGLLHYNAILDNQQYDSNGQLIYGRLRVFDTPEHVPSTPGGSETLGLEQQYDINATYAGANVVTKYTLKRVL